MDCILLSNVLLLVLYLFSFTIVVSAQDSKLHAHHQKIALERVETNIFQKPIIAITSNNETSFKKDAENRISGGVVAIPNEYPWIVFLETFKSGSSTISYACEGTLINNQWILTSAACLNETVKINVYLGAHDLSASFEQNRVIYTSTNFIKHPSWVSSKDTANNIGLVKLPNAITFTNQIKSIDLPSTTEGDHVGETIYLAGWGKQAQSDFSISPLLRKVTTTVMSNTECQSFYGSSIVTPSEMCSRGNNLAGICAGDSGGPMMYRQTNGNYIQLGIASFLPRQGCSSGYPSGFTRVNKYVDWIKATSSAQALIPQSFKPILLTAVVGVIIAFRNTL